MGYNVTNQYFDMVIGSVIRENGGAISFVSTFLLDVSISMLDHVFIVGEEGK